MSESIRVKPRVLSEVIARVLALIPAEYDRVISQLKSFSQSSLFAPPESQWVWWRHATAALADGIGDPTPDKPWSQEVADIWNAKK